MAVDGLNISARPITSISIWDCLPPGSGSEPSCDHGLHAHEQTAGVLARALAKNLIQLLRLNADILLPCRLFLVVLFHPRFKALARGGIPASEFQAGDVAVGNLKLLVAILGEKPHITTGQFLGFA